MKYLVILAFLATIASLGTALFFMMKNRDDDSDGGRKMAWALALRVAVSILLFVSVLLAWKLGYIQPTGISSGR